MLKWGGEVVGEVTRGVGGGRVWVGSCWLAVCLTVYAVFGLHVCTLLY
jgi:hypothetical protein